MIKKTFFTLHKWLGLLSGSVVMIVALTGLIYLFAGDLAPAMHPHRYYLEQPQNARPTPLPMSRLIKTAKSVLQKDEKLTRFDIFPALDRTWIFRVQQVNKDAVFFWNYYLSYKRVYINPYSGKVVEIENSKVDFFAVVLQLHRNLLMGERVGKRIVNISTVCLMIVLISGIFLWWPKKWTRKRIKRHLTIKAKAKKRRVVYDIHRVFGFYSFVFLLIIAFTGVVMGYPGLKSAYTRFFNRLDPTPAVSALQPPRPQFIMQSFANPADNAYYYVLDREKKSGMISCRLRNQYPEKIDFQVRLNKATTGKYRWYYFDNYGKVLISVKTHQKERLGSRLASSNYDIHAGLIWGNLSKILAGLCMVVLLSLPVTGLMIYFNGHKKQNPKKIK